jgi:hypothetical protein
MLIRPVLFVMMSFVVFSANASSLQCKALIQRTTAIDLISGDLLDYRNNEIRNLSRTEIKAKNRELLKRMESYVPLASVNRAQSISSSEAVSVLKYMQTHEVVGTEAKPNYKREDVEIGYCFGRATFLHLLLLKMGLQKGSILKVWAVGPQKSSSGEFNWDFHVADIVYVRGFGWMTLDSGVWKPQPLDHWISHHTDQSLDGKIRFYVTDASRFTPKFDKYSPVQMGLNIDRENDWYRHYFKDMMASFSTRTLEELGLSPIKPSDSIAQPEIKPPGVTASLRDFFGL